VCAIVAGMSVEPTAWRRPGPTARQLRNDVVIGVAVAAVALFNLVLSTSAGMFFGDDVPSRPEQVLWTLAVTLPLAVRRRWPAAAAIVISIAFIGAQVRHSPEQQIANGALSAAIYTLGAWDRDRARARWAQIGIVAAMFTWLGIAIAQTAADLPADAFEDAAGPLEPLLATIINGVLLNALFFGFAIFFGEAAWISARRQHLLEVQAEELRRLATEAGERAIMGERVRIARELHDVVAHHVSVMGVQAAAARRVMEKDLGKARTALAAVEQGARTAVEELRRMLSLLRATGGTPDERPTGSGVDRVDELVSNARDAGLAATLGVYGEPVPLPESLSQAAYRIVQEAVTNALKHANASALDVRVRYHTAELEIDVTDDGRGAPPGATAGVGLGLIGMRERVTAHDGTLEAGSRADGGYRVRARFPLAHAEAVPA
jgi:signal transduction histidine kinase